MRGLDDGGGGKRFSGSEGKYTDLFHHAVSTGKRIYMGPTSTRYVQPVEGSVI